jgi:hypothetical protein
MQLLFGPLLAPRSLVVPNPIEDVLSRLPAPVALNFLAEGFGHVGRNVIGRNFDGISEIVGHPNRDAHDMKDNCYGLYDK